VRLDELRLEGIQGIPHGHRVKPRDRRKLIDGQRGAGEVHQGGVFVVEGCLAPVEAEIRADAVMDTGDLESYSVRRGRLQGGRGVAEGGAGGR